MAGGRFATPLEGACARASTRLGLGGPVLCQGGWLLSGARDGWVAGSCDGVRVELCSVESQADVRNGRYVRIYGGFLKDVSMDMKGES